MNGYEMIKFEKDKKIKRIIFKLLFIGIIFISFSIFSGNKNGEINIQETSNLDYEMKLDETRDLNNPMHLTQMSSSNNIEKEIEEDNLIYRIINANNVTVKAKNKDIESVTIKESYNGIPVTSIAYEGFSACRKLKQVIIPSSIVELSSFSFNVCDTLTTIGTEDNLVEGVINISNITQIDAFSFNQCESLKTVILSNDLTELPYRAFMWCTRLVTIGTEDNLVEGVINISNITQMGAFAFADCYSLTKVILSKDLTSLSSEIFRRCTRLKTMGYVDDLIYGVINISGINTLESSAFSYCESIRKVKLSDKLEKLEQNTFYKCSNLVTMGTEQNMQKGVVNLSTINEIGPNAFSYCSLMMKVILSDDLTILPSGIFSKCTSLTQVGEIDKYIKINNGIKEIGESAFKDVKSSSFEGVIIPASVEKIGAEAFSNEFEKVFCESKTYNEDWGTELI